MSTCPQIKSQTKSAFNEGLSLPSWKRSGEKFGKTSRSPDTCPPSQGWPTNSDHLPLRQDLSANGRGREESTLAMAPSCGVDGPTNMGGGVTFDMQPSHLAGLPNFEPDVFVWNVKLLLPKVRYGDLQVSSSNPEPALQGGSERPRDGPGART